MATTNFSRTLATTSDAETCWTVLTDVSRVAGWVTVIGDVAELEPLAKYTAVLMDKVGPFKLRADLAIEVPEVDAPHRIHITAAGEDRQVASRIAIDATLEIKSAGPGDAEVDVNGSYSVTGRVASLASRSPASARHRDPRRPDGGVLATGRGRGHRRPGAICLPPHRR